MYWDIVTSDEPVPSPAIVTYNILTPTLNSYHGHVSGQPSAWCRTLICWK